MQNFRQIISATLIAVGLLVLGLCIKAGIDNFAYRDRVVAVRGLAERTVEADWVAWPVRYAITGNDLAALYERSQATNAELLAFLKSNGIPEADISVNPPEVYDAAANEYVYGNNGPAFTFKLTSSMTVLTTHVDKVRQLLRRQSELLAKGIVFSNSEITYEYTGLNSIKPQMIAEATKNARKAAQQFADDSDCRIGNIKSAEQGYFSIENKDDSTPYIKKIRVVTNVLFYLDD